MLLERLKYFLYFIKQKTMREAQRHGDTAPGIPYLRARLAVNLTLRPFYSKGKCITCPLVRSLSLSLTRVKLEFLFVRSIAYSPYWAIKIPIFLLPIIIIIIIIIVSVIKIRISTCHSGAASLWAISFCLLKHWVAGFNSSFQWLSEQTENCWLPPRESNTM